MDIVVHYNEIGLKGRNRPRFEERLKGNLTRALHDLGNVRVRSLYGRVWVSLPDDVPYERAARRLRSVFGVAYFGRTTMTDPTVEAIEPAVDAVIDAAQPFESFGVRARRIEKRFPLKSSELAAHLGTRIQARTGAKVDLTHPDFWLDVHVLNREAIVFHGREPGPGGMPVGAAGRAMALLSGGIDSPVAAREMQKRGLQLELVHFHSSPFTSAASQEKVRELAGHLAAPQGKTLLHLVPFGELQQALVAQAPAEPRIVLYRRFMLRIAETLANRAGALALVTGESLGQVSSQTLGNLDTINRVAQLPVLRPLIGRDKSEIIQLAQSIGTYEISIEPDEDCCSFLMPRRPATWTRPEAVDAIEAKLEVEELLQSTVDSTVREDIEPIHV